jgi:hypothetical protein
MNQLVVKLTQRYTILDARLTTVCPVNDMVNLQKTVGIAASELAMPIARQDGTAHWCRPQARFSTNGQGFTICTEQRNQAAIAGDLTGGGH